MTCEVCNGSGAVVMATWHRGRKQAMSGCPPMVCPRCEGSGAVDITGMALPTEGDDE